MPFRKGVAMGNSTCKKGLIAFAAALLLGAAAAGLMLFGGYAFAFEDGLGAQVLDPFDEEGSAVRLADADASHVIVTGADDAEGRAVASASGEAEPSENGETDSNGGFSAMAANEDGSVRTMSWNGHVYAAFDTEMTWAEAAAYCKLQGGRLVSITSQAEQDFVFGSLLAGKSGVYWLGLSYLSQSGTWFWVTGERYGYNNYMGEPIEWASSKVHGAIYASAGYVWLVGDESTRMPVAAGEWAFLSEELYGEPVLKKFICEWSDASLAPPAEAAPVPDQEGTFWADPVDLSTGAQVIDLSYLDQSVNVPFSFGLRYDGSRLSSGEVGKGWSHSFEKSVAQYGGDLYYFPSPLSFIKFSPTENGTYTTAAPGKSDWVMTQDPDGVYTLNCGYDEILTFLPDGRLFSFENRTGDALILSYEGSLTTITDTATGRSLVLERNGEGLVAEVRAVYEGAVSASVRLVYDAASGSIASVIDANGNTAAYTYDGAGHILTGTDADGIVYFSNAYDASGRIASQDDAIDDGKATSFSYVESEEGKVVSAVVTDREGGVATHAFDESGRLISRTDQDGRAETYEYDADGNLVAQTDGAGRKTLRTYDGAGNLLTETDPLGNSSTYTYDERGNLLSTCDADGIPLTNTFDQANRLKTVTNAEGTCTDYFYGSNIGSRVYSKMVVSSDQSEYKTFQYEYENGLKTSETNPEKNVTVYVYDAMARLVSETDPNGNTTNYTYDSMGNLISMVDQNGSATSYEYDCRGNMTKETDPNGGVRLYDYNGNGKLVVATDATGNRTTYEYDAEDRLAATIDPLGNRSTIEYSAAGLKLADIDAEGRRTVYSYDDVGHLISKTSPGGHTTSYAYDAVGRLASSTDALGNVVSYEYSAAGKLVRATDQAGFATTYSYDTVGRLASITDPEGGATSYSYDATGNLVSLTDPLGNKTTYSYDKNGNLLSSKNAKREVSSYAYDAAGNLMKETDPIGSSSLFSYDAADRLIATQSTDRYTYRQALDASGNVLHVEKAGNLYPNASYAYDAEDRMITETLGADEVSSSSYDAAGRLQTLTNARGQSRSYTYDASGRLTGFSDAEGAVAYTYDVDGNLLSATDATGSLTREYDALGRVVRAVDVFGDQTSYTYDARGNLTELTYAGGKNVSYTYDDAGRMTSVTDWAQRTTSYAYDTAGNLVRTERPEGSVLEQSYDTAGRVVRMTDATAGGEAINGYTFTYDAAGRIVSESSSVDGVVTKYSYKADGFLSSVKRTVAGVTDEVSFVGGRGNVTKVGDGYPSRFDVQDRLISFEGRAASYDADGNMTTAPYEAGETAYSYDSGNRLVGSEGSGGVVDYLYDALDNRISRTDTAGAVTYAYDASSGSENLLASTDSSGTTYYVWGMGLVGSEGPGGEYLSYHFDVRGSTAALTDNSGNVTDRFTYGVYGTISSHEGSTETPFLFNGLYGVMDDGDGLIYMRARYYSPELMRFLSVDPVRGSISDPATLNRYAFARGNPVMFMDPFGRSATLIAGGHTALDAAGLIPGAGMFFDIANGVWYAFEGDWSNAGLSMLGAVPVVGDAATGAKLGAKALKAGGEALEGAAKLGSKAEKAVTSVNQMAQMVKRGQAPRTIVRVDKGDSDVATQPHVHFTDGTALNIDGTVHDKKAGAHSLTKQEREWLQNNGWL